MAELAEPGPYYGKEIRSGVFQVSLSLEILIPLLKRLFVVGEFFFGLEVFLGLELGVCYISLWLW